MNDPTMNEYLSIYSYNVYQRSASESIIIIINNYHFNIFFWRIKVGNIVHGSVLEKKLSNYEIFLPRKLN